MMSSEKQSDGGLATFESSLERDFYVLLEFSENVVRWDPQPVRLPVVDTGNTYVPDVLVSYIDDLRDQSSKRRVLYEVKYREELRTNWADYRPRFKAAIRYARKQGWSFRLVTEREIRSGHLLWNAKFLLPYLHDQIEDGERALLLRTLTKLGQATPELLLNACSSDRWERARLLNAVWILIARREIGTDLNLKLTMTSQLWGYG